jgi:hypothetical protein
MAFHVFQAGRASKTRVETCAVLCFVRRFRVYVCVNVLLVGALSSGARERVRRAPSPFSSSLVVASIRDILGVVRNLPAPPANLNPG